MLPHLLKSNLLLPISFALTHAINTYSWTPSNWTAGISSFLSINNDLFSPNSMDAAFDNLTIFLSAFDTNIALWSFCYLSPTVPNTISSIGLIVPPSIAPQNNNLQFALGIKQFKKDHSAERYQYTRPFHIAGLQGGWSNYETSKGDITPPGLQDRMPCSAYPCARECVSNHGASDLARPTEDQKVSWDCVAACEGVEFPEWVVYTSSLLHQAPSIAPLTKSSLSGIMMTETITNIPEPTMRSNGVLLESADVVTAVVTSVSVTHVRASASVTAKPVKSEGSHLEIVATALCTVVLFVVVMTLWNLRLGFWVHL